MAAEDIYNFESIIPAAVKTVLEERGLTVFTLDDSPTFQKVRPRVEVVWRTIGEATPKRLAKLPDDSMRTSCFRGELKLHCITDADDAGKRDHGTYRARIRDGVASLQSGANATLLTFHSIQFVVSGNEETGIRVQDGYEQTTFPYQVDVSIMPTAWSSI